MSVQIRAVSVAAVLLMQVSGNSIAQSSYAELEPKGIKALSGAEAKQVLSGAKVKGETAQGYVYELQFAPDGNLGGWVGTAQNRAGISGTWNVNEKQQYCWDYTVSGTGTRSNSCRRLFRMGDDYYVAVSGQGREAKMGKLDLSR